MPELPDLEVFSTNLEKALAKKKLTAIEVPYQKKLNVSADKLRSTLKNQILKSVTRSGKALHFNFEKGDVLELHLMLRGQLHFFEDTHEIGSPVIELLFSEGIGLVMSDFQKQATATLNPAPAQAPDALDDKVNVDFFINQLSGKRSAIKNILLDQHQIRGIGNAYADEILWDARISPFSIAGKIPEDKIKDLNKSVKNVLEDSREQIRKAQPGSITGEFRDFLKVHTTKNPKSPTGSEIKIKKTGSRKTYYTDEQKLFV